MTTALRLRADRLLPADPPTRNIARRLLAELRALSIVSPRGQLAHDLTYRLVKDAYKL